MIFVFKAIQYCQLMYLTAFVLDPAHFISAPGSIPSSFKKAKVKLDLLNIMGMLLMAKNDISGGICHAIHRYEKTNNNYMNDYDVLNDKY